MLCCSRPSRLPACWRLILIVFLGLLAAPPSRAAIIYSGLDNISIPTGFDGIYLDLESGATSTGEFAGWDFNPFFGGFGVANSPDFQPARTGTGNEDAIVRYNVGNTIGGTLLYSSGYGGSASHLGSGSNQFEIGQEGYLAFRLITNGGLSTAYGWVRVVFTANTGGALIKDWAYEDSGSPIVAGRVQQEAPSAGVQRTVFSPAVGESFTYGSLLGDPGGGIIGGLLKTGAGSTNLQAAHSFTGATTISGGVLQLGSGGKLSATSQVTVNAGGTLLFSGSGGVNTRLNSVAPVSLAGGTISTGGLTGSLDQQFGVLTLSLSSVIDMGLLAGGNTFRFANSAGVTWASGQTLRIYNYTTGVDRLFVGSDSAGLMPSQLNSIQFYSDAGFTLLNVGAPQFVGAGEISPAVVPEPTSLAVALGILGLAGWRERRRSDDRRRAARRMCKGLPPDSRHDLETYPPHP